MSMSTASLSVFLSMIACIGAAAARDGARDGAIELGIKLSATFNGGNKPRRPTPTIAACGAACAHGRVSSSAASCMGSYALCSGLYSRIVGSADDNERAP